MISYETEESVDESGDENGGPAVALRAMEGRLIGADFSPLARCPLRARPVPFAVPNRTPAVARSAKEGGGSARISEWGECD